MCLIAPVHTLIGHVHHHVRMLDGVDCCCCCYRERGKEVLSVMNDKVAELRLRWASKASGQVLCDLLVRLGKLCCCMPAKGPFMCSVKAMQRRAMHLPLRMCACQGKQEEGRVGLHDCAAATLCVGPNHAAFAVLDTPVSRPQVEGQKRSAHLQSRQPFS
eukprot:1146172-Pelagomonas_calceolata.AAC.2